MILALDIGLGLRPALANAIGYAVGICLAWMLHRGFVFRSADTGWAIKARYLTTVAVAFGLNQLVLLLLGHALDVSREARIASQMCGLVTYTATQFILMRTWVFVRGGMRQ